MSPRTRHPAFLACLYLLSAPLNADSPAATATTQDNPGDLQTQARSNLAATEYEVSAQPGASCAPAGYRGTTIYQAPNRTHNLRSCFTADGVLVVPRIGEAGWHWGLMLAAYGDDSELHATTPSAPAVAGNRVEYTRGSVTEWFVNDANGLEQGFTLHESVTSEPATILRIGIRGDLQPAGQDGAIAFRSAGGVTVINYGQLKAWDAAGAVLPATMRLVGSAIELKIATAGANYPVTIDPVGTSGTWSAGGVQAGAEFGTSVATAGDVNGDGYSDVIIGAPLYDNGQLDEGRAFVWLGSSTGLSVIAPAWTAESNQLGAGFGTSVATAGDVNGDGYADVIVGAPQYSNGHFREGRAFVYLGSATGLATTPAWSTESNQDLASYGSSVSTAGDVNGDGFSDVIVGAFLYDSSNPTALDAGRIYVYHGSAAGLATTAAFFDGSLHAGDQFGASVATAGDVNNDGYSDVVVGAPLGDLGLAGFVDEGLVTVILGSPDGLTTAGQAFFQSPDPQPGALFGASVATAGDTNGDGYSDVIVGVPGYAGSGIAYVFRGSPGNVDLTPLQTLTGGQPGGRFGSVVGTAGDVNGDGFADVIVGAPFYTNDQANEGRAFVYLGNAGGINNVPVFTGEFNQANAFYGAAVGTAGDVNGDGFSDVIVGAYRFNDFATGDGEVAVYRGSADGLSANPVLTRESDAASAGFGWSVATAGDVNGDGHSDVIVGAPFYGNGQNAEGRAFVYLGNDGGLSTVPDWSVESNQEFARLGYSVATAGDVNGDGHDDVIVGAYRYTNGETQEGRAFVYLGGPAGLATVPAWTAESNQANSAFGRSVATAGDVNGDGYSDVIIGAHTYANNGTIGGRAFVYLGSSTGLALAPSWSVGSNQTGASFGRSVATAGDVNRDGYSDVIVSAPALGSATLGGQVFVYLGGSAGLATVPQIVLGSAAAPNAFFGFPAATAGDVNGDGYADVIIGWAGFSSPDANEGAALVYLGSGAGISGAATWTVESNQAQAQFGGAVASAGDVNNDGYSDVIVGAPGYENGGQLFGGLAFAYLGSAAGLSTVPAWTRQGDQIGARFGSSVAAAGDVNGDGYPDVIAGAPSSSNDQLAEGRASLYLSGNSLAVRPPVARQHRAGDTGPLASLDASGSLTGVNLQANGRSPFGRSDVRIEYEIKPLGTGLDGTGLQRTPGWTDSGSLGAPLAAAISNLSAGNRYHWRARVAFRPSTTPFQSHGPWLTTAANGLQELDFRTEKDTDNDSVFDRLDNCFLVANTSQLDADSDGYGNICDADLNNSGTVTTADFGILRAVLNQSAGSSATAAAADLNGSGTVTTADFAILRARLNTVPGPSGLHPGCPPTCP